MPIPPLLAPDEPPPFEIVNPGGRSTAFLICDHASPLVPRALADLGLGPAELLDHIGWDIGAAPVARRLSALLDAPLVLSGYSRLVIDCNRPPGAPTSIPAVSGGVPIPGNAALDAAAAARRAEACFWPYHRAITALLDERAGRRTALLSIHSFTPCLLGQERPWQVAMLYRDDRGRDRRLAALFLAALREDPTLTVGDNQPYRITDGGDYGIPVHGERRGLPHVLVELRHDGLATEAAAHAWAGRLAAVYRASESRLFP